MKVIELTGTKVVTGESMTITVPVTGYHRQIQVPIIELNQISDDEWQALAKKLQGVREVVRYKSNKARNIQRLRV